MENLDHDYLAELVERAREHDSDALAELYAASYPRCYQFACQYLKNTDLALEALQQTFILVFKNIGALRNNRLVVSWIDQILFRVCLQLQKRNEPLEQTMVRVGQHSYLMRQVLGLPFSEAQALIHFYHDHLSVAQIAKLMRIRQNSVKHYLESGEKKLAALVER